MGSVDPNEFWERMKSDRGGGPRGPERGPEIASEPARLEQAPQPTRAPDWDTSASSATPQSSPPEGEPDDTSVSELMKQLTEQTKALVRQEMRLAQAELKEKGKKVGIGAGMFGAGGLVAFFGAATLITATVLALSTALAGWLAALIVALVLLAVAGGAALTGKKKIEQATPPLPEQAVETVKEDVEHVKERARK